MIRIRSELILLAAAACAGEPSSPAGGEPASVDAVPDWAANVAHDRLDAKQLRDLATLAMVTAPFHRDTVAARAGWSAIITGCMSHPTEGAMGMHQGNPTYIGDGKVAVDRPELLVYEPDRNGRNRLVAVEYIVPFTDWKSPNPPRLFGRNFAENKVFGIWALHVWLWKANPSGLFADWNPRVTCRHAPPAMAGAPSHGAH